jgi:hypothetical protein
MGMSSSRVVGKVSAVVDAIISKVGEVRLLVIVVGGDIGGAREVGKVNAIADEAAMLLERCGERCGVDGVSCKSISGAAIVRHRDRGPAGIVAGIGETNVGAGIDNLVVKSDGADPLGIGDFCGDGDHVGRGGSFGEMCDLTDGGRR